MPPSASPDALTRKLVVRAYAQFCAQRALHPETATAKRFAVEVTESGAREYHGLDSARLERLLDEAFPAAESGSEHSRSP